MNTSFLHNTELNFPHTAALFTVVLNLKKIPKLKQTTSTNLFGELSNFSKHLNKDVNKFSNNQHGKITIVLKIMDDWSI